MLVYDFDKVLQLVPEAHNLTKEASFDQELPFDSADSALASFLHLHYQVKIANELPEMAGYESVCKVLKLNGLEKTASELVSLMVDRHYENEMEKAASSIFGFEEKVAELEDAVSGMNRDIVKAASLAQELDSEDNSFYEKHKDLAVYAGHGMLKVAQAVDALDARFAQTGDDRYLYMSKLVAGIDPAECNQESRIKLASMITNMDVETGLVNQGWDFYREAFDLEKTAADMTTVILAGKQVPYAAIARVGKDTISAAIGKDVADALTGEPTVDRQILETLPLDLQQLMVSLSANV